MSEFSELIGKTLREIKVNEDNNEIVFITECGKTYLMHHCQDCCEFVIIEDICGDLDDLIGTPILKASEDRSDKNPEGAEIPWSQDSFTWTFYNIATIKGYVTLRWYGESNGYYSESVNFDEQKTY
jgi:hypothetical protein